jgi:hypothetical protein
LSQRPKHGADEVAVVELMRARFFDFGGFTPHSYWDMYFGYGLLAVVFAFFVGALLWLVSDLSSSPTVLRRLTAAIAATVAVHAVIVARFFFMLPLVLDLLVLGGTLVAMRQSRDLPPSAVTRDRIAS